MTLEDHSVDLDALGAATGEAVRRAAGGEPLIVTSGGAPVAALVSVRWLQALQRDRELLRRLALGELESAAGEGGDLDAVLDECRLLLEES